MYELRASSDQSISMQGKQAKMVNPTQERAILGYLATTRYPMRDRVLFLLSMKAGLRATPPYVLIDLYSLGQNFRR